MNHVQSGLTLEHKVSPQQFEERSGVGSARLDELGDELNHSSDQGDHSRGELDASFAHGRFGNKRARAEPQERQAGTKKPAQGRLTPLQDAKTRTLRANFILRIGELTHCGDFELFWV